MKLELIKERIIKDFIAVELLDNAIYPTLDAICRVFLSEYRDAQTFNTLLNNSHYIVDKIASSKKFQQIYDYTRLDITILYKFVDTLTETLRTQKILIQNKVDSMLNKLGILQQKAEALIASIDNVDTDFEIYNEDFSSLSKIDTAGSTAEINTQLKHVTSYADPKLSTMYYAKDKIDSITVSCLNPVSIHSGGDSTTLLYDGNEDTVWSYNVELVKISSDNGEILLHVKLKEDIALNRIMLISQNPYKASLLMIKDNSWSEVIPYTDYVNSIDFQFPTITINQFIVKLTNITGDTSGTTKKFLFNINDIQFSELIFAPNSILKTLEHTPSKAFSVLGVFADETLPEGCDMSYNISVYKNNSWVTTTDVKPVNRDGIDFTKFISVSNTEAPTISSHNIDMYYIHPYNSNVNNLYHKELNSISNVDFSKTKILRDIGNFKTDRHLYSCYFYLTAETELSFKNVWVDKVLIESKTKFSAGLHYLLCSTVATRFVCTDILETKSIYFGSEIAQYVDPTVFLNIAEDDNYKVFTFALVQYTLQGAPASFYVPMLKALPVADEEIVFMQHNLSSQSATKFKVTVQLTGFNNNTAILKNLKIKTGV